MGINEAVQPEERPPEPPPEPDAGPLRRLFEAMVLIRAFEPEAERQYKAAKIGGYCHLATGQEAAHAGAIGAMDDDDVLVAAYRDHGIALARGVAPEAVMAELFGRVDGCAHGRGGSMHLLDVGRNFFGGWGIVGGHLPVATGLALEVARRGEPRAVLCELGDGAVNTGAWHESLNLAALWRLPIIFYVVNNVYGMGTHVERASAEPELHRRARAYRMHGERIDGDDLEAVYEATGRLLARARDERAPAVLEAMTYRYRGHSVADAGLSYRTKEEIEEHRRHDPIDRAAARLGLDDADVERIRERAEARVREAVEFADSSPEPDVGSLGEHVYVDSAPAVAEPETGATTTMTVRDALRLALREEMERDERVFLLGEEIGLFQGSYRVTAGLLDEFGEERVRDTPISEEGFVGAAIGAAMGGGRPVVEIMTVNFSLLAMDQIVNNAAKVHYMFGGEAGCPLVIRMPGGGGSQLTAQHSQSFDAWFAHVPGLKVLAPATPADARGLLKAAIRDDDPVLVLESFPLYNQKGDVPDDPDAVTPIGRARVAREGADLTIVAHSYAVVRALSVAERLADEHDVSVEVIDLRSLRPLDFDTVAESVGKTTRALCVEEGWATYGVTAEIAARIQDACFDSLDAPVRRVGASEVPLPYAKNLERAALLGEDEIAAAARAVLG
jgi:2-oxoisovalerate dehydrogenase E1 component